MIANPCLTEGHDARRADSSDTAAGQDAGSERPAVVELRLESFAAPGGRDAGNSGAGAGAPGFPAAERPHLLAILSDGSLLLYRAARPQVPHASELPPCGDTSA